MAVTKTIEIDGKEVTFKASAAVPRMYRIKFRRDIFKDMNDLMKDIKSSDEEISGLSIESLEIFENIAYMMAKYADPNVPDNIDEWLEQFNTFSIYMVMPHIVDLWGLNIEQQAESKKNFERLSAK
jgi:hypothetical protein